MPPTESHILGPFIGDTTASSAIIWLHFPELKEGEVRSTFVTLHQGDVNAPICFSGVIDAAYDRLNTGVAKFELLQADTLYFYKLWEDASHTKPLDTDGLTDDDLHFQTLPANGYDDQLDFLLMSCHNPETTPHDGADGFAIFARLPEIMTQNKNVRFAILAGDQIYADEVERRAQKDLKLRERQELYLGVYKKFWDNIFYRKVLCSLPAVLMWDDHDITDGWGSRLDRFERRSRRTSRWDG